MTVVCPASVRHHGRGPSVATWPRRAAQPAVAVTTWLQTREWWENFIRPHDPSPQGRSDPAAEQLGLLIDRCARRDARALEELYGLVAPRLLACLVRMLRRRELAEDVLQDVFVQIWQRAGQFDAARGQPLAWLVAMTRYRAIDDLRNQRRAPAIAGSADELELAADDVALDVQIETDQAAELLRRCLEQLTDEQRKCLRLAFWGGHSHEEVASAINSPLGTVKSWIRRGLHSLRQCLQS